MSTNGPQVGDQAPDFTLPSTGGGNVTLSVFRGETKVLLAFFPLAFTGTCTAEMCDFTKDYRVFKAEDATVFGVSVDSIPTLHEFRKQNDIQVDMLSDFKRDVSRAYGTLLEEHFFSDRAYFIIDKNGVIRWRHSEEDLGDKRNNAELLAELKKTT